jgi:hypothetical protein
MYSFFIIISFSSRGILHDESIFPKDQLGYQEVDYGIKYYPNPGEQTYYFTRDTDNQGIN